MTKVFTKEEVDKAISEFDFLTEFDNDAPRWADGEYWEEDYEDAIDWYHDCWNWESEDYVVDLFFSRELWINSNIAFETPFENWNLLDYVKEKSWLY